MQIAKLIKEPWPPREPQECWYCLASREGSGLPPILHGHHLGKMVLGPPGPRILRGGRLNQGLRLEGRSPISKR